MKIIIVLNEEITTAFGNTYGYNPVDNPQSVEEFTREKIENFIKEVVQAYKINIAVSQAKNSVDTTVDLNTSLE